jgi:cardiolipin synthase
VPDLSWVTLGFTAYLLAAGLYIVAENRRPASTFAWLFLFLTVPLGGLVVYVLFGRRRRVGRTRKLLRQDRPAHLEAALAHARAEHEGALSRLSDGPPLLGALARLVHETCGGLVTTSNRAEVLHDAAEAYPRLIADMEGAQASIHLQYYIWRADALGARLADLLARKAAEGVEVRLLYDPVGSLGLRATLYWRRLRRQGVDARPSSPLWRVHSISYRNHRKIAVIDGRVGYTGGLNIGDEHLEPGHGYARWRDVHLRLTGTAVHALQAVFAVDWANATRGTLLGAQHFPPVEPVDGLPVQLSLSGPDSDWRTIRQQYFGMITGATRRVRVQTPYFVLDESLSEAIKAAALSGVDVSVMVTNGGPDQRLVYWAAQTYLAEVASAGAEVLLYRGGFLHAKTVVTDGEVASVGSGNWDIRSFSINYELNALVYDRGVAAGLERAFEADRAHCVPFDPVAYYALSRPRRLRDSLARLVSPLL